ncbi:MAG TPA: DUF1080 domain-containing protein [Pirellulales bacterium]|nr:DUF1080 domain-containing protein [Pirellulales bacterium]
MRRRSKIPLLLIVLAMASWSAMASAAEPEWKTIFDGKTLEGWQEFNGKKGNWDVVDGLIHCKGKGGGASLETVADYSNFELELEYRMEKGGNSGVYLRIPLDAAKIGNPSYTGMEIQLLDDLSPEYAHLHPEQYCGSVYDVVAAKREFVKPAGEWGKIDIVCDKRHVKVTLNDHEIVKADLDDYKAKYPTHPGIRPEATTGHVGLQNHTGPLGFRNVRIRVLE